MTQAELLQATAGVWRAKCYRDGNRRQFVRLVFCRAVDRVRAQAVAAKVSGCRVVDVVAWDPRRESVFGRWLALAE